jgi:hypothetical protein
VQPGDWIIPCIGSGQFAGRAVAIPPALFKCLYEPQPSGGDDIIPAG